jgi:2-(1,2-epoxy-1,2-dihydrophenyl)acetyl-CoA isomerase
MTTSGGNVNLDGVVASFKDGVAVFRLARPEARNALNIAAVNRLQGLLRRADKDHRVRCIVITGTGKDFCTGGDLSPAARGDATAREKVVEPDPWEIPGTKSEEILLDYRAPLAPFQALFRTLWELETPVVGGVNGTVAGIGWMLAFLCDFVIAASGARFTHVFSRRGMMPHAGDTVFLPRVIPLHRLTELAMLSDTVTAETLNEWGLLHKVVAVEELEPTVDALAQRLASGPTISLGQAKRLYRRALLSDVEAALAEENATLALVSATADRQEGMDALREGRAPTFKGV